MNSTKFQKMKSFIAKMTCGIAVFSTVGLIMGPGIADAQNRMVLSQDTVKIGVLTDMAGIFSDLSGAGSITAAQMAIDDFKQQAKPTFKIELISADHQNKADIGASKAREWYDTQGVDMIADVINSGIALAVAKVANDKNRIVMVSGSGTTRLHNEDCNPYTVHYGWDT